MHNMKKEDLVLAINQTLSMTEAATLLHVHYNTFRRVAIKFGLWKPNQAGKGVWKSKTWESSDELFSLGTNPKSAVLRRWYKKVSNYKCTNKNCGNTGMWLGKEITLELDHINGNNIDNRLENLRWLCPNCHSQTPTWKGKNINESLSGEIG